MQISICMARPEDRNPLPQDIAPCVIDRDQLCM